MTSKSNPKVYKTEIIISYVLRTGVILCASIISIGVVLTWINPISLDQFSKTVLPQLTSGNLVTGVEIPHSASRFLTGLAELNSTTVIALGLFLLILLPIIRVALTVVVFFLERDLAYFLITLFVLTVLLSGLFFGKTL